MLDQIAKLRRISDALVADASTPWYLVEIVNHLIDIVSEQDSQADAMAVLVYDQGAQKKAIDGLKNQYSEVLYKLKSGE